MATKENDQCLVQGEWFFRFERVQMTEISYAKKEKEKNSGFHPLINFFLR